MENTTRHYNTKDVDMLVSASTIIESAIANKTFLQSKRSTWADPFFDDLKTKINTAIQTYLGIDSAKDLRQSTQAILNIQTQALTDLAEAKVQITEDFKNNPPKQTEILTQLGFTSYHKPSQRGDQEALINLLFQFKTNLTETLKTEIAAAGTAPRSAPSPAHPPAGCHLPGSPAAQIPAPRLSPAAPAAAASSAAARHHSCPGKRAACG